MPDWKYLMGLVIIVSIVWMTMIICLAIVYLLLPQLEQLTLDSLFMNVIQLMVAGLVVLAWLYSWNMLARFYFHRNLSVVASKTLRKRRESGTARNRRANP